VITAAVLKLYRSRPPRRPRGSRAQPGTRGRAARAAARAARERLTAFELVSRACLSCARARERHARSARAAHPWYVLAELADSGAPAALHALAERTLVECAERGALADVALASSEAQSRALWKIRETIPRRSSPTSSTTCRCRCRRCGADRARLVCAAGRISGREDLRLRPRRRRQRALQRRHARRRATEALMARREEVNRVVYDVVDALGGSISAEHGLGQLKRDEIRKHKDPLELALMRALKARSTPGADEPRQAALKRAQNSSASRIASTPPSRQRSSSAPPGAPRRRSRPPAYRRYRSASLRRSSPRPRAGAPVFRLAACVTPTMSRCWS